MTLGEQINGGSILPLHISLNVFALVVNSRDYGRSGFPKLQPVVRKEFHYMVLEKNLMYISLLLVYLLILHMLETSGESFEDFLDIHIYFLIADYNEYVSSVLKPYGMYTTCVVS